MSEELQEAAPVEAQTSEAVQETPSVTETPEVSETGGEAARSPISEASDFSLPEEYQEKSWAKKVKSQDDVYKLIENQEALIGKKTIQPIDFENSSAEEIAEYHKKLAPEKGAEAYEWSEHSMPDIVEPISEAMLEAGVNPYQQKLLAGKFDEIVEKIAGDKFAADTSEEGYLEIMKESFGDNYQESVGAVERALKQFASDGDKQVFDTVDNATRAAVDRTTHEMVQFYENRIANILKEHGVTESGAQAEGGEATHSVKSPAEQRAEIRAEMRDLDGKPNGHARIKELQQKLNKLL